MTKSESALTMQEMPRLQSEHKLKSVTVNLTDNTVLETENPRICTGTLQDGSKVYIFVTAACQEYSRLTESLCSLIESIHIDAT